ncbi:MAG: M42 family metallopeptidase [Chloroflexi bacterium]|nr:M42 family metallopeptidase [Chloroflexota bacterium]MCI0579513.1 M42 family metallopeptidase [Chloroflexota bacterium]MCI0647275.1 M42 family metallopeptidase [Chloroflexota bacterium]MCI0729314.1 M42 family metallopeptidase [Chloroflexota bacterium]
MNELLKQLSEASGVSGFEKEVRRLIRDLIADSVDEWRVDTMGNLIATRKGTGESDLRIMVDAHMDEVGLVVTEADSDGTLKFEEVGGFDDRALLGKVVQVGPQRLTGVIGARPLHLLRGDQRNSVVKADNMRIDIGAKKKDEAARKVEVGDPVVFVTEYEELDRVAIGKALDNRVGCAVLVELLRGERYPFDLVAAFTVQEEVGLRGARVAAYAVRPDAALILECTPAHDLPNKRDVSPNVSLGRGASVYVMDANAIQDPRLVAHITRTAAAKEIPFQIRQPGGGGTNTGAVQSAQAGVPVATLAVPVRYLHSPVSMVHLDDYANLVKLADATLRTLTPNLIRRDG